MGEDPRQLRQEIEQTRAEMGDTVGAISYKTDVSSRAKDKVSDAKESAMDKISDTKDKLTGKASSVTDRASSATPDSDEVAQKARKAKGVAQDNPLGLAIGAVAVGFLAGLVVPATRVEDEKLGPAADKLKEQAKQTGQEALQRGQDVVQQAAETAKEAGKEQAQEMKESQGARA